MHTPPPSPHGRRIHAFTLVEMIVTLLVIGVLSTIAVIGYGHLTDQAEARRAQANLRIISSAVLADVALNPGADLSRERVTSTIETATSTTVTDGLGAATTYVGFADQVPGEGQYSVAFSDTPDVSGEQSALLVRGGGKTFGQILSTLGGGHIGVVPDGATPSDVLADPSLISRDGDDSGEPEEPTEPAAPATDVTVTANQATLTITWAGDAANYNVTAVPTTGPTLTCATSTTSCVLDGAAPNTQYQVTVTALYDDGHVAAAEPVTALTAPAAVSDLTGSSETGMFTWTLPAGATTSVVETRTGAGAWTAQEPTTETSFQVTPAAGQSVAVRVTVLNAQGSASAASPEASITSAPAAPAVTGAPLSTTTSAVTSTVFSWPAVESATSYRVDVRNGAGQWVSGTPQTTRTATVPGKHARTTTVRVTAIGTGGASPAAEASRVVPDALNVTLKNGWQTYHADFGPAQVTRGEDGLVSLSGLIKSGTTANGTVLGTLPEGYRPAYRLVRYAASAGGDISRVDIRTNGDFTLDRAAGAPATWLSLNDLKFLASDAEAVRTPATLNNGWSEYFGSTYGPAISAKGPQGRSYFQAMLYSAAGSPGTSLATFGTGTPVQAGTVYLAFNSTAATGTSVRLSSNGLETNDPSYGTWMSFVGTYFASTHAGLSANIPLSGAWSASTSTLTANKTTTDGNGDGLVTLMGAVSSSATVSPGTVIGVLPEGYRPQHKVLHSVLMGARTAQIEIHPNGNIVSGSAVSNVGAIALSGITFRAAE